MNSNENVHMRISNNQSIANSYAGDMSLTREAKLARERANKLQSKIIRRSALKMMSENHTKTKELNDDGGDNHVKSFMQVGKFKIEVDNDNITINGTKLQTDKDGSVRKHFKTLDGDEVSRAVGVVRKINASARLVFDVRCQLNSIMLDVVATCPSKSDLKTKEGLIEKIAVLIEEGLSIIPIVYEKMDRVPVAEDGSNMKEANVNIKRALSLITDYIEDANKHILFCLKYIIED